MKYSRSCRYLEYIAIVCTCVLFAGACESNAGRPKFANRLSEDKIAEYKTRLAGFRSSLEADDKFYVNWELRNVGSRSSVAPALSKNSKAIADYQARSGKLVETWLKDPESMLTTYGLVREIKDAALSDWIWSSKLVLEAAKKPETFDSGFSALAEVWRPNMGYRMAHALVKEEFAPLNVKRVHRVWKEARLGRKRRVGPR